MGLRKNGRRGFDVIDNMFFVEQDLYFEISNVQFCSSKSKIKFSSFEEYYKFLDGDIYENACYYKYTFKDNFSINNDLNFIELKKKNSFIKNTIDDTPKLPKKHNKNTSYKVKKAYVDGMFVVSQSWRVRKKYEQVDKFEYFFDFVAFLKGDLSEADLLFCDGLKNLPDITGLNFSKAKLTSGFCDNFSVPYKKYKFSDNLIDSFENVESNEENTKLVLKQVDRDNLNITDEIHENTSEISYISDLHLMHRIRNANCKSKEDAIYTLQKIIDCIVDESANLTLIGGDISSDISIFTLFIKMLRKTTNSKEKYIRYIFVLGNHELWSFSGMALEDIVDKYRTILTKNGMWLLHNELLTNDLFGNFKVIRYSDLLQFDNSKISNDLLCSKLLILGGIGFSGYNEKFNANNGVYKNVIDRNKEIQESKKFEFLYNKLYPLIKNRNSVVFTHMPKEDWTMDNNYSDGIVYVSGHTHRNTYFDDGLSRIYADNQIGYYDADYHIKSFLIDSCYDYFCDYNNGIYEISLNDYKCFLYGKRVHAKINRELNILYMLKKNGFYCFICKNLNGSLFILNGGATKKLKNNDVNYYYSNMDEMIKKIEEPLIKYTGYQEFIANKIKKIGGSGLIHGCIIDIDRYNHIYINPNDMKITSYWASDIIYKIVYPNIALLLKAKCRELYDNYLKLIGSNEVEIFGKENINDCLETLPVEYLETDIYRVSREVKKMQKLKTKILTTWYDDDFNSVQKKICISS